MRICLSILTIIFLSSCVDWEYPHDFPIVLTHEVQSINSDGAQFNGSVESLGLNQSIIGCGFVWSESKNPTLNSSYQSIVNNTKLGSFSKTINNDLVKDATYYVRAFVQTSNQVIYGNQVKFESQGSLSPLIVDFNPKKGFDGTEILLKGKNFSLKTEGNLVKIGALTCDILSASDTLLVIKSPKTSLIGDYLISITVAGKTGISKTEYSILGPRIRSLSKTSGRVGDLLTISGDYFDIGNPMKLLFGPHQQWISNESIPNVLSPNLLECYIPNHPNTVNKIELHSYTDLNSEEKKFIFPENFAIVNSWEKISDSTPIEKYNNGVPVGYGSAVIKNSLFVIGGKTLHEFNTTTKAWIRRKDFPGSYRFYGICFSFNDKLYYGFGEGYRPPPYCCENENTFNDLWEYDPNSDLWNFIGNSPIGKRSRAVSIVINNKIYIGFGVIMRPSYISYKDLWEVDVNSNTWNEIIIPITINGSSIINAKSFAVNNKGYVIGFDSWGFTSWDSYASLWEFDPVDHSWKRKSDYPDMISGSIATTMNNHGLVAKGSQVYEYDPFKDRWIRRQQNEYTSGDIQFAQYINSKLYFSANSFWELNFE